MKEPAHSFGLLRKSFRWGAGLVLLSGVATTFPSGAYGGGITSSSFSVNACRDCHTGTSYPTASLLGVPAYVLVGASEHIYLQFVSNNSSTLTRGGFNARVDSGSLSTTTGLYGANISAIDGEVTHDSPQAGTGTNNATYRFGFDFDAPAVPGTATVTAWGNNVNNNGTNDSIDSARSATATIAVCKDADNDGNFVGPTGCPGVAGDDCNDGDPSIGYNQTETCDNKDNDCDGTVDDGVKTTYYRDADGDGFGNAGSTLQSCSQPTGYVTDSTDCDDTDPERFPSNPEVCDGKDNNCNTTIDEGVKTTYYRDLDLDTYGNPSSTTQACSQPAGFVSNSTDCDDACNSCHPGGTEVCDGENNDCDADTDEASSTDALTWYFDDDGDGFGDAGSPLVSCYAPTDYVSDNTDCDDSDGARHPGNTEICDGKDNDCSSSTAVDMGCDDDNDDWCDASMTVVGTPPTCSNGWGDCADGDAARYPGNAEMCDGKDNDCSSATPIDVGCDDDNDDYCDASMITVGTPSTCTKGGGDCDDGCINCNPGGSEVCDGKDNDCDTNADEDISAVTCGFGVCQQSASGCTSGVPDSCTPLSPGEEDCSNQGTDDDCDADVNEIGHNGSGDPIYIGDPGCVTGLPGVCSSGSFACSGSSLTCSPIITVGAQVEICDNLDNDCDGALDEGCDDDNDGYCDEAMPVVGTPATCVLGGGDCNDNPATGGAQISPGAAETCSNLGVDNDCDDDDLELTSGVYGGQSCTSSSPGDCAPGSYTCSGISLVCVPMIAPGTQTEVCDGGDNDCDGDADEGISDLQCGTGACANTAPACDSGIDNICLPLDSSAEICDDIDNDCDGSVDEGCDDDGDDYCDADLSTVGTPDVCPGGGGDCDDASDVTHPTAGELCDDIDNDCDGDTDEAEDIELATCGKGICKRTGTTCEPESCTPGAAETEVCDDLDNDCDGTVDNGCDDDGDGYCDEDEAIVGTPAVCSAGVGDCNDDAASTFPGAPEVCDLDDNDCDDAQDEVAELALATCGVGACERTGTSCDPASCTVGTPLQEICDGLDNDCDNIPDDGLPLATCGEGACQTTGTSCLPSSCVPLNPEGEVCDGVDNDCDGVIDDGCDDDKDGYCDANLIYVSSPFCEFGGGDCDDESADAHPGAEEICDGQDNDCNGTADDDVTVFVCGVGACQAEGTACSDGEALDCTPLSPSVEVCDGLDNDCDGLIDDGIEEQSCGVGECLVIVPGCALGDAAECQPLSASDEVCDGLDNDCDSHIDNDAFCVNGACIAGKCVSAEDLGLGGDTGFPGDFDPDDVERWLEETTDPALGGASQIDRGDYEMPHVVDRGSCSSDPRGGKSSLLWFFLGGAVLLRWRRRNAA